jgi:hypothetical protein
MDGNQNHRAIELMLAECLEELDETDLPENRRVELERQIYRLENALNGDEQS